MTDMFDEAKAKGETIWKWHDEAMTLEVGRFYDSYILTFDALKVALTGAQFHRLARMMERYITLSRQYDDARNRVDALYEAMSRIGTIDDVAGCFDDE